VKFVTSPKFRIAKHILQVGLITGIQIQIQVGIITGSLSTIRLARFISLAKTGANSVFMAKGMAEKTWDPNWVSNFLLILSRKENATDRRKSSSETKVYYEWQLIEIGFIGYVWVGKKWHHKTQLDDAYGHITGNAHEDEPVVADVMVQIPSMTVGLSNVFAGVDFRQKLFRHFRKIADAIGMSGKYDVPTCHNAEQNRHLGSGKQSMKILII
jgi:hypothetical protein